VFARWGGGLLAQGGGAGGGGGVFVLFQVEEVGGLFELFVLEEFLHQFVAGVGQLFGGAGAVALADGGFGEEHGGLDFHQGGGHDEEVAGDVDVESVLRAHGLEESYGGVVG